MKFIKYIRKMIYEYELNPHSKIQLCPSNTFEELVETFKAGKETMRVDFGIQKSSITFTFTNLTKDMLFNNENFLEHHTNFEDGLKKDMVGKYYPRYKFLSKEKVDAIGRTFFIDSQNDGNQNFIEWGHCIHKNIDEGHKNSDNLFDRIRYWCKEIKNENINKDSINELEEFLKSIFSKVETETDFRSKFKQQEKDGIKKLVTAFDILKYKK